MATDESIPTVQPWRISHSQHDNIKLRFFDAIAMRKFRPLFNPQILPKLAGPRAGLERPKMLRLITPRRSVFSASRLPMRVESRRQQGQIARIEKVRIVSPWPSIKTMIQTVAVYCVVIYVGSTIYSRFVVEPLDRAAMEAFGDMAEDEEDEEYKPLFIPFPGTTKQLKPIPYKGSDPEWQEFIKFSKDQRLAQNVREELASFVKDVASKHPLLKVRCGSGFKLRRYWLDVDFPQYAPPQFERSGIEIDNEHVAIAKQPVDSVTVFRTRHIMWPSALVQSFWSFIKVMATDDANYVAQKFGFNPKKPPASIEQIVAKHQQMFKASPGTPQLPTKDSSSTSTQSPAIGDGSQAITNPPGRGKSPVTGEKPSEVDIGSAGMALHAHFIRPIMAFKAKLAQTWRPAPSFPPKGSILVSGLVELDTPKAWLVFDVKAAWDPKIGAYDHRSMHVQLRRMQLKKQGPVGGH